MSKFVVISGQKANGKDFFSDRLIDVLATYGMTATKTAFAKPIKIFCHEVFGFSYEDMESQEGKEKKTHLKWSDINKHIAAKNNKFDLTESKKNGLSLYDFTHLGKMSDDYMTIREVLQVVGTDVIRDGFYEKTWCQAPFRKQWSQDVVIITDCRFPNEVEESKKFGGIIVRIIRPSIKSSDNHISETALNDVKFNKNEVFINDLDGHAKIDEYIKQTLLPRIL